MAINLQKGGQTELGGSELLYGMVGLSWDEKRKNDFFDLDLDLVAFMLNRNGIVSKDEDFIFYNNLVSSTKALKHTGDERTGATEGDDEIIAINFSRIPDDVQRIVFAANIHDAKRRRQTFGMAANAVIRFVQIKDPSDPYYNIEKVRYCLTDSYENDTCVVFCELFRSTYGWKFRAIGEGYNADLAFLCNKYGLDVM